MKKMKKFMLTATFVVATLGAFAQVGIGTTAPTTTLDVNGTTLVRNGGISTATSGNEQILFSYDNGLNYKNSIRTRHNAGNDIGNAIDFYTWDFGIDAITANPTRLGLSVTGGRVGVGGILNPTTTLDVVGANNGGALTTTDGITVPRVNTNMTTTTTTGTTVGQLVYSTNAASPGAYFWSGSAWSAISTSGADGDAWAVTGENVTGAIGRTGNVGIGITVPTKTLDVNGEARIRTLPAGNKVDNVVTVDADGNLRKVVLTNPITSINYKSITGVYTILTTDDILDKTDNLNNEWELPTTNPPIGKKFYIVCSGGPSAQVVLPQYDSSTPSVPGIVTGSANVIAPLYGGTLIHLGSGRYGLLHSL